MNWDEMMTAIQGFLETSGLLILRAIAILMFGLAVIRVVMRILRGIFLRSRLENSIASFLLSVLNVLFYFVLLTVVMTVLNVPLTSFVVVTSAAGLAISLALQDSLSNLANGFLIVSTKPFKEGDYVEVGGVSGTVKAIKMMNTKIQTTDNKVITVPNKDIMTSNVVNYNARDTRRVEIKFGVAYGSDVEQVKQLIRKVISENPQIMTVPEPFVRMSEQAASSLNFTVRVWTAAGNYWDVYYDLNERVYRTFTENGIEIPFNQLDVNVKSLPESFGKEEKK